MSKLYSILLGAGMGTVGVLGTQQIIDSVNNRNQLENVKIYTELNSQKTENLSFSANEKHYLEKNQASSFNRAIGKARKVKSDSSSYKQAQADITRWSEVILDIAYGRASQGDFSGAIAAAKLVPQNETSTKLIAQQATKAIQDWLSGAQKQELYQNYIVQAKIIVNPGQASSYEKAISVLQQIPPEVKEYSEAQNLMKQWNK